MSTLIYSDVFQRPIRKGDWKEQTIPTYRKIQDAIHAGKHDETIEFIEYFDVEAAVCYKLFAQWHADAEHYLREKGMSEEDLEGVKSELKLLVNHWVDEEKPYDRDAELDRYRILKARLVRQLNAPVEVALATLAEWKELWRSIHDRDVDYVCGLFNTVHIRHGEAAIEEMYRDYVIGELFDFRYERFDVSKSEWSEVFEDLIYVSIEAMRGHLVGPNRDGTMELDEFDDRIELTFSPCGSGGRSMVGDKISGTPSRHEAPYYYHTMQEKHDFNWNKPGVCHYCVHCAVLMEKLPMEKFGYPVRIVEPPTYPDKLESCKWTMYKDPRTIPDSVYERMGEKKPGPDEPLGSKSRLEANQASDKQRAEGTRLL